MMALAFIVLLAVAPALEAQRVVLANDYWNLSIVVGDASRGGATHVSELYLAQTHARPSPK